LITILLVVIIIFAGILGTSRNVLARCWWYFNRDV